MICDGMTIERVRRFVRAEMAKLGRAGATGFRAFVHNADCRMVGMKKYDAKRIDVGCAAIDCGYRD